MLLLIIIPDNLILGHPITDILFFSQIIPDNFIAVGGAHIIPKNFIFWSLFFGYVIPDNFFCNVIPDNFISRSYF